MTEDAGRFRSWRDKAFKTDRLYAVVKIGGSVVYGTALRTVVEALESVSSRVPVLVFPGGGAPDLLLEELFEQKLLSGPTLAATTALALDQTGLILADQSPRLTAIRSIAELQPVLVAGHVPILLPSRLLNTVDVFRATNRVSSDSMAGWVAHLLGVGRLVLVKSRPFVGDLAQLRSDDVVDEVFPDLVEEYGIHWSVVSAGEPVETIIAALTGAASDTSDHT